MLSQTKAMVIIMFKKLIGDKKFYRAVIILVIPLVIQQGITSFVNLLDNVMVGALSTEAISGVAIVNQLIFVFNLTIFGGLSGASIYGAQYSGVKDYNGVRYTFRFKVILGVVVSVAAMAVLLLYGDTLIGLYLHESENGAASLEQTLLEAKNYLSIAIWGLIPFMFSQCYASTLREMGETKSPMIASIASFLVNLCLNYVLIYGKLGLPAMGVRGAALATVIARVVETAWLMMRTHTRPEKFPFIKGAFKSLGIPLSIVKKIAITGTPLLLNELFWSMGTAFVNQCYSTRGVETVAAVNIAATVWQLFSMILFSMGSAISIMVGQQLGNDEIEAAKDTDRKLIALDVTIHVFMGALIIATSGLIPQIYNVSDEVRRITTQLLIIDGLALPLHAFTHAAYFSIRSGGRTFITFLFDSVFLWVITAPMAYLLANFTGFEIKYIFFAVQFIEILKALIGFFMLKSGTWARNVIR